MPTDFEVLQFLLLGEREWLAMKEQAAWQKVKAAEVELAIANEAWEIACTAKREWEEQHDTHQ